jgi:hypothetical protein
LLAATACGSKGAVTVLANIEQPTASVEKPPGSLVWVLNGGFNLHVELGQVSPTATDVSLQGTMTLVRPSDQASLVALKLAAVPAPPYHLEPGAHVDVRMTMGDAMPGQQIILSEHDAICQAHTVQIAGSLTDSASGKAMPVTSESFEVSPCL